MQIFSEQSDLKTLVKDIYPNNFAHYDEHFKYVKTKVSPFVRANFDFGSVPFLPWNIGLEIELENCYIDDNLFDAMWCKDLREKYPLSYVFTIVEDHSLRGHGYEFVSRTGLTATEILAGTRALLQQHPTRVLLEEPSVSYRTSIHVHFNVYNLSIKQLRKIVLWYMMLEPLFFSVSGGRAKNIFCVPLMWTRCSQDLQLFFKNNTYGVIDGLFGNWRKYCAFNLLPIKKQGTIEFRHHKGTANYEEIENWIVFLHRFMDYVVNSPTNLNETFNVIFDAWQNKTLVELIYSNFDFLVTDTTDLDKNIGVAVSKLVESSDLITDDMDDQESSNKRKKNIPQDQIATNISSLDGVITWTPNGIFTISTT